MGIRPYDEELERSTDRWMMAGAVLMGLLVLAFPLYRVYEPAGRAEASEQLRAALVAQGEVLYQANCAECHGERGEGVDAPALNSQQFLTAATDDQVAAFISTGVPGTEMGAYHQDFGGPLTAEQIMAIAEFIRTWEPDAPDRPDWRDMIGEEGAHDETGGHDEGGGEGAHGDGGDGGGHDEGGELGHDEGDEESGAHDG